MDQDRVTLLEDPQLRPFLPLLYVAWADGDLGDTERGKVLTRLEEQPWLRPAARLAVANWLDRARPPAAEELRKLKETLYRIAGTQAPEARQTLAALASELAQSDAASEAARELADLLGARAFTDTAVRAETPPPTTLDPAPEIDVAALQRLLDGPHAELRDRMRAWLGEPGRRAYGLPMPQYRSLVMEWLRDLGATGIGDLAYPGVTSHGDLQGFMAAFETLALGDLSLLVKCGVQFGLFGGSILNLGTARHHALLPAVAKLDLLGCFAMSEVGHGSNVADLETVARYDHATRELVIHTPSESARKDWIGGAAHDARMATVFAQLEVGAARQGVHAVLVPIRDAAGATLPGIRAGDCGHKMGLNGVDNGRLWFDNVRVPVDNLLDRFARITPEGNYESAIANANRRFFVMLGTLVGGRICVGSAGVSAAKVGLTVALRYAVERRQFGPTGARELPLLAYPTHQRRLIPALASTYVYSFAFEALRKRYAAAIKVGATEAADTRVLEAEVAVLKAAATTHGVRTLQDCREACGGQGYLSVNRLADAKADADVFTTFEGDNTVLWQLVAKSLLTGYKRQFEGVGWAGVLRNLGGKALSTAWDKNPIATRRTDSSRLRSREEQLQLLGHREESLVASAAQRVKKRLDAGEQAESALLELQEHLVAAARAHGDRLILSFFHDETKGAADPWIDRLGDLHALSRIEAEMGWFLEHGFVEPAKARAIRKEVEALIRELAPAARSLVDAFGIPDAALAAPIAFFDPAHPRLD
jgi:acyl-CoA oxidase